jgi:hypothetical protein
MRRSLLFAFHVFLVLSLGLAPLLVSEARADTRWKVLYQFTDGSDGAFPNTLILNHAGNLYGTTQEGGDPICGYYYSGCGVVF